MSEDQPRYGEDQIDAKVRAERDRVVKLLRDLADRIEGAPLHKITEGLAWVIVAAEPLMRAVERALGKRS